MFKDFEEFKEKLHPFYGKGNFTKNIELFKFIEENEKKIFIDSKIKFMRAPILSFETFNINIIKELNTEQLKFLHDLIQIELEKREG